MTGVKSRWSVLAAYGAVCAATQAVWVTYAPITADTAEHFGVSVSAVGWLAQVFPLVYVLLAIPAGMLLDRFLRGGLLLGGALTASGGIARVVVDDYTWALIGQSLAAVGQPLVLNAVTGIAVGYLAERDRANGIAAASAATFGGVVIGFAVGALLPGVAHVRTVALISGALSVAAVAWLAVALRQAPARGDVPALGGWGAFRTAWSDPYLRRICAVVFIPFGTFVALSTFAQPLLEPAGVSESAVGLMLVVNVVAGVVGCAVVPGWAQRRRREIPLMTAAVVIAALGCGLLAVAPGVVSGFAVLIVLGLALLPTLPIVLSMVEKRAGEAEATAAGLVWMAGNLGGLVVAVVVGLLVETPTIAFAVLAAITLAAAPVVGWFRKLAGG